MDIDFPLILTWAVIISGSIWGFDRAFLFRGRKERADKLSDPDEQDAILADPTLVEYARSFFPVLLLVLVLRSFLFEPYQIPSGSMIPTLLVGDFILVNKYAYGLRLPVLGTKVVDVGEPDRGDVMVFIPPHEPRYFIKRVVGLPGDNITYDGQQLVVNGKAIETAFVAALPPISDACTGPGICRLYDEKLDVRLHRIQRFSTRTVKERSWSVPDGHYFMMGDNRDVSDDSRRWGFVPEANIVGKAVAIWIHKDPGWALPTFARNGVIE